MVGKLCSRRNVFFDSNSKRLCKLADFAISQASAGANFVIYSSYNFKYCLHRSDFIISRPYIMTLDIIKRLIKQW